MKRRGLVILIAVAAALGSSHAAARASNAQPQACSPCTYRVSPAGTGPQSLTYVLQHFVQAHDTVLLADGVAVDNHQGLFVFESSQVSLSHNLLRGNLVGIEAREGRARTPTTRRTTIPTTIGSTRPISPST